MKDWKTLEGAVANYFRRKGAIAKRNVTVGGSQIDVLVEERTTTGEPLVTIVECKSYARPVGVEVVRQMAA
jgi:hypothetical protein